MAARTGPQAEAGAAPETAQATKAKARPRRRRLRSIRWRIQAWHALVLLLVVASFALTAWALERSRRWRVVDEELQRQVSVLAGAIMVGLPPGGHPPPLGPDGRPVHPPPPPRFGIPPGPGAPPRRNLVLTPAQAAVFAADAAPDRRIDYVVWLGDARELGRSPLAPRDIVRPAREDASPRTRGNRREAFLWLASGDCVLVSRPIDAEQADLRALAGWLAGLGALVFALGLAGGGWIASRALRPVEDISAAAVKIAAGDLSERIRTGDTKSELGGLALTLNATFARLEAAFAQQGRFASDAAHELRTPLTVILTQVQGALARERPAGEYREALEGTLRAARRMRRLVESLLDLARLDAGQEPMAATPCDLAAVAEECAALVEPLAAERGLRLVVELAPAPCRGDAERLALILTNLLTNAVRHHPGAPGTAWLRTGRDEAAKIAWATVADDGSGLGEEGEKRAFERFWRGDAARSGGGAGLGLAIAKAIAEAHGGTLAAGRAPEGGAEFTLRLPAV